MNYGLFDEINKATKDFLNYYGKELLIESVRNIHLQKEHIYYFLELFKRDLQSYGNHHHAKDVYQNHELVKFLNLKEVEDLLQCNSEPNDLQCALVRYLRYIREWNNLQSRVPWRFTYKLSEFENKAFNIKNSSQSLRVNDEEPPRGRTINLGYRFQNKTYNKTLNIMENKPLILGHEQMPEDKEISKEQISLNLSHNILSVVCLSQDAKTLFQLPTSTKIRLDQGDYYNISNSECFIISQCFHGNIQKDTFLAAIKNQNIIIRGKFKGMNKDNTNEEESKNNSEIYIQNKHKRECSEDLKLFFIMGELTKHVQNYKFKKEEKEFWIGSSPDCAICIHKAEVNKKHLRVRYEEEIGWVIMEVESTVNGSYLWIANSKDNKSVSPLKIDLNKYSEINLKVAETDINIKILDDETEEEFGIYA